MSVKAATPFAEMQISVMSTITEYSTPQNFKTFNFFFSEISPNFVYFANDELTSMSCSVCVLI